ncbi:phosphotransferase [Bacillus sp. H-16]|uniref:phosphotransferase n=1 Tax=Alteribacter salitolerans TaxID=2912333 RepID=UPI0019668169|nr:phosphotransferase [Alteribacter salitolerans]MBM7094985.1 phosphotransferase [Alteribacter salitolerans]
MKHSTLLNRLSNQFKIHVSKSHRIVSGVYKVRLTNGSVYALKSMPYPISKIKWIDRTLNQLRKSGFSKVSWRHPSKKNEKVLYARAASKRVPYILTPWVKGRWASPYSKKDMIASGKILAEFHLHAASIKPSEKGANNRIGSWPSELEEKYLKLNKHIQLAAAGGYKNILDSHFRTHGEEIKKYAHQSLRLLEKSSYQTACKEALRKNPLCHGDGGPGNIIITKTGPCLIDFETLCIDLRSYDLYRVIFNSCHQHNWDFTSAKHILDGYQSVTSLKKRDFELLKVLLRFPRTTALVLNKYHRSRLKRKKRVAKKLLQTIHAERKVTSFIHQLDLYAKKSK